METEDIAQDQGGALARRQDLESGHERQRDGFPRFVHALRAGGHAFEIVEQCVRVWLEPDRFPQARRLRQVRRLLHRGLHLRAPAS
jgi:hypothetical protein